MGVRRSMGNSVGAPGKRFRLAVVNSHPIQYFAPLYRQIAKTPDIDITVYYCSRQGLDRGHIDPGFGREVVWDVPLLEGYRSRFLPNLGGDRGVRGFFSIINLSIIGELLRERYDAVLIHGHNLATNILALVTAKLVGTKVFMRGETHLQLERGRVKNVLRKPVMSLFYLLCDAFLYIGTRNREFYEEHRVPKEKLFCAPYAVDNQFFIARSGHFASQRKKIREELGIADGVPVILYASKLTSRKRPMDLMRAFNKLRGRGIVASLVVVGDGPERASIERFLATHGDTNVKLLGFKNQSELPKYYAIADMFVLPSENEPWGLVINEVMCAGIPVITTREVGAATDLVVEGKTGCVYGGGDWNALSSAMANLLENGDLRMRLGRNALERIKSWGYPECISGIRGALQ